MTNMKPTLYIITRHKAAEEYIRRHIGVDNGLIMVYPHLKSNMIFQFQEGDLVVGNVPMRLAAKICERGARYFAVEMTVPVEWRGKELTYQEMVSCNARLAEYEVKAAHGK